jgi:hypothetical protein
MADRLLSSALTIANPVAAKLMEASRNSSLRPLFDYRDHLHTSESAATAPTSDRMSKKRTELLLPVYIVLRYEH